MGVQLWNSATRAPRLFASLGVVLGYVALTEWAKHRFNAMTRRH